MEIKNAVTDTKTVAKLGERAVAAARKEVPTASAAVKTKLMKFNQDVVRPKIDPIAKAFVQKVAQPAVDKGQKLKNALVQRIESPDRKYIQDYKRDRLPVHFKEAARQPLTLKRTVAEPKKPGDKQAQAQRLLARITAPKALKPGPQPGKRPTKTK